MACDVQVLLHRNMACDVQVLLHRNMACDVQVLLHRNMACEDCKYRSQLMPAQFKQVFGSSLAWSTNKMFTMSVTWYMKRVLEKLRVPKLEKKFIAL
jgi:hypothetical protein